MSNLDPISEFFTRIKNANHIRAKEVEIPASNLKLAICEVMKKEGFISDYKEIKDETGKKSIVKIELKYTENRDRVIHGIKQISTQGCRIYVSKNEIPYVMGGYGIAILTTSKGVLTDKEARKLGVGGEVICYIW